jgi:hypothetical protein
VAEVQLDLFGDYKSNVALYPKHRDLGGLLLGKPVPIMIGAVGKAGRLADAVVVDPIIGDVRLLGEGGPSAEHEGELLDRFHRLGKVDRHESLRHRAPREAAVMVNTKPQHTRNDLLPTMELQALAIADIKMPKHMVRKLDPGHIQEIANGIQAMGFSVPVLVGKGDVIIMIGPCSSQLRQITHCNQRCGCGQIMCDLGGSPDKALCGLLNPITFVGGELVGTLSVLAGLRAALLGAEMPETSNATKAARDSLARAPGAASANDPSAKCGPNTHVCTLDPSGHLLSWPQTAISLSKDVFKRGFERNRQCPLQPSGKSPRLLSLLP